MGYYVRVLSTSTDCASVASLKQALISLNASLSVEEGTETDWEQLTLSHGDGREIAVVERNLVEEASLGSEELDEFREEIAGARPESGAEWLLRYFDRVKCIYACQLLSGTDHLNGWEIFGTLKQALWSFAPSILQADNEGFTNEDGYHILWQFNDDVSGKWWMGVARDGGWDHFEMELGAPDHRESFLRGEVPSGLRTS